MTYSEWFIFFAVLQVIHFLGTWKLYQKAGRKYWEAAVPVYNTVVLMKIINRPVWWVLLLFIPVIQLLMLMVIWIETIRSFKFYRKIDSLLVIVTFGFYIFYINYATEATYNENRSLKPRSELGEWVNSISFAIIAATFVHTYFMQPFTIPSSSLEKSLLIGDYLFVSKFHYGARIPMTPVALPMVHDSIFFTKKPSYLKSPQLPYMRLPGIQKIKNNEIVCFNWPADSLKTMWGDNSGEFTYKPIDKKTNYVKRAVGIAGDTLELRNGFVYINEKKNQLPDRAKVQFNFNIYSKKGMSSSKVSRYKNKGFEREVIIDFKNNEELNAILKYASKYNRVEGNKFKITTLDYSNLKKVTDAYRSDIKEVASLNVRRANLTLGLAEKIRKDSEVDSVVQVVHQANNGIFPHIESNQWSQDNMGPIYIPEKGSTVQLTAENIPFYTQVIRLYEHNNLVVFNDKIYINGKEATSYTFKQDYYWLMGDNRHNSLDSRYWGFVPFDHVLGKPVMIWFSWDADAPFMEKIKSIRWNRMFSVVHGDGEIVSYRYWVFGMILFYFIFSYYSKRKKTTKK